MTKKTKFIEVESPPEYYPGRAVAAILQGPNEHAVHNMITAIDQALVEEGLDPTETMYSGPDQNGGWKAIIAAHNVNPVTWFTEKVHRARIGLKGAVAQGKRIAETKQTIARQGELARAAAGEYSRQRVKMAEITGPQKEREKTAAIVGIGKERIKQELAAEELASAAELGRLRRRLATESKIQTAEELARRQREYEETVARQTPVGIYDVPPGFVQ